MPLTLPDALIAAKNLLADIAAWIVLAKLDLDNTLRLADNTEDITWDGETWTAFPFKIEVIGETSKGEVPQVTVRVSNVSQVLQAQVEAIDGAIGSDVTISIVHTGNLNETTVPSWTFQISGCRIDSEWCVFTLGAVNPFTRMFPVDRIMKTFCRFKFKSGICGYSGGETECDKTLTRCRVLNNSDRFGGFPGVGSGAIYV